MRRCAISLFGFWIRVLVSERKYLENERELLELQGLRDNLQLRKEYGTRLFYLVTAWLAGVSSLIAGNALLAPWGLSVLSENVQLALIGGASLNLLGILAVVVNYLFPRNAHRVYVQPVVYVQSPLKETKWEPG